MSKVSTVSGRRFDLANPVEADVDIHDIAHGLSQICRYGGQTNQFYSVAQHSTILSHVAPQLLNRRDNSFTDWQLLQIAKAALLHDASEAYTGDIKTPLKNMIPGFRERIEDPITEVVFKRFNVDVQWMQLVDEFDKRICANEMERFFFTGVPLELKNLNPIPELTIAAQPPEEARRWFYNRYKQLFGADEEELRNVA